MPTWPINPLAHHEPFIAEEIRLLMFASYQVEADLLGAADFFPLSRTAHHIATAEVLFWGIYEEGVLAAVLELEDLDPTHAHINSLVVHPAHFRRGMASALLQQIIHQRPTQRLTVSTGVLNHPALALYAAQGFAVERHWATPDGIAMVTLGRPWLGGTHQ